MARFYGIDEANAALPDVERILLDLRDQRAELIRLRDLVVQFSGGGATPGSRGSSGSADPGPADPGSADPGSAQGPAEPVVDEDARRLRLRMQGLIDQMQAGVTRLVERDVMLREIESGLIDFPALASGRPIWLCWRLGEGPIEWWHEHDAGVRGRKRLAELT